MAFEKYIIVTGASRGVGYDTVLELAQNPQYLIAVVARNEARLQSLKSAVDYPNVRIIPTDLTQLDDAAFLAQLDEFERLDILINNAGLLVKEAFEKTTLNQWQTVFSVNFFAPVHLVQLLLPKLKAAKTAHIVNLGSMGGVQGSAKFPGLSAYSASKAALANLTECLAEELKEEAIRVNCLALGAVQTEMLTEAFPGYEAPVTSAQMGAYVSRFALEGHHFFNGKVLPVAVSTP